MKGKHITLGLCAAIVLLAAALPAAALAQNLDLYFEDDFSDPANAAFFAGTLDDRVFSYGNGRYEIDTLATSAYGQSVLTDSLTNYRAEVTGQMMESGDRDGGGLGISVNYTQQGGEGEFLLFLVYDRGAFTVLRYKGGLTTQLYSPTRTQAFEPGSSVKLRVDMQGGFMRCFINGLEVAKVQEDSMLAGGVGLFATGFSRAQFDDFRVFAETQSSSGFSDDFETARQLYEGDWQDIGYSYQGGAYVIDTSATDLFGLSPFPQEAMDFEFAADVQHLSGDELNPCGLYFRDHENASGAYNQYRFLIAGRFFAVEKSEQDMPLALSQWEEHSAINAGGANSLKVRCDGGSLTFSINGIEVARLSDAYPHSGSFGFFASAGIICAFDNAEFTELP